MEQIFRLGIPYLLVLVLPGFIYGNTRRFTIGQETVPVDVTEAIRILIRSIMVTVVTMMIMSPGGYASMVYAMAEKPVLTDNAGMLFGNWQQAAAALLTFVVLPCGYGAIIGAAQRKGWSIKAALKKKFRNRAQPSDQAIDQAFWDALQQSKGAQKNLVIGVHLDQGVVYGLYGSNSKISESGGYRDIYLEATWQMNQDGCLAPSQDGSSIFIKGSTITALVFFIV